MTKPKSPPPSPRIISMQGEVQPLHGYAAVTYQGAIIVASFNRFRRNVVPYVDKDAGERIIRVDIIPSGETKP